MVCGAPTCPACSVAGFCKADLEKVGGVRADRFVEIDRGLRKVRSVSMAAFCIAFLSIMGTLGFIMINFQSHLGLISFDSIFWLLALAFGPMCVLLPFMIVYKDKATVMVRERDGIIRELHTKLAHIPRDGYYTKHGFHTFICSSCQGPTHVERATCMVCFKPICPHCNEGGLCPAHAAALTSEDKALLLKTGDFDSKIARNMMPLAPVEIILIGLFFWFGNAWVFLVIALAVAGIGINRLMSIWNAQKRLKAKTGVSSHRLDQERPF